MMRGGWQGCVIKLQLSLVNFISVLSVSKRNQSKLKASQINVGTPDQTRITASVMSVQADKCAS